MPGIALTADFSRYHKKDQPWAATGAGQGWVVSAEWRDQDRHAVAQETAFWTLDANGNGAAQLSAAFLNAVFQAAAANYQTNQNQEVWFHRPGLYLNVFADDATYRNYEFGCAAGAVGAQWSNWNFGGSLSDLVEQLKLGWWPGLPAVTNAAAQANLSDPLTVQCAYPAAPTTTTTTTKPSCASTGGFTYDGHCWFKCVGNGSRKCSDVCSALGGAFDATVNGYFTAMASDAARQTACQAILDGIAAGGTGAPAVYTSSPGDQCVYYTSGGSRELYHSNGGWLAGSNKCGGNDSCACTF